VEFIHRSIAWVILILVLVFGINYRNTGSKEWQKSLNFAMVAIIIQFVLGVTTLLLHVPVILGVLHQLGAILVLLAVIRIQFFNNKPLT